MLLTIILVVETYLFARALFAFRVMHETDGDCARWRTIMLGLSWNWRKYRAYHEKGK